MIFPEMAIALLASIIYSLHRNINISYKGQPLG